MILEVFPPLEFLGIVQGQVLVLFCMFDKNSPVKSSIPGLLFVSPFWLPLCVCFYVVGDPWDRGGLPDHWAGCSNIAPCACFVGPSCCNWILIAIGPFVHGINLQAGCQWDSMPNRHASCYDSADHRKLNLPQQVLVPANISLWISCLRSLLNPAPFCLELAIGSGLFTRSMVGANVKCCLWLALGNLFGAISDPQLIQVPVRKSKEKTYLEWESFNNHIHFQRIINIEIQAIYVTVIFSLDTESIYFYTDWQANTFAKNQQRKQPHNRRNLHIKWKIISLLKFTLQVCCLHTWCGGLVQLRAAAVWGCSDWSCLPRYSLKIK